MIKLTTKNGETDLSISGTMSDICADTVAIVMAIRKSLAENNPHCGEFYEEAMKAKLIDLAFNAEDMMKEAEADKAKKQGDGSDKATESKDAEDTLKEILGLVAELLK